MVIPMIEQKRSQDRGSGRREQLSFAGHESPGRPRALVAQTGEIDPRTLDAQSRMPAFYKLDGLTRVATAFQGKPLLQPQEIEDVLAYLATLK